MACCDRTMVSRLCGLASGLFGFSAVVLGALGAHLLGERLELHHGAANFDRAKLYLFIHSLILAAVTLQLSWRPTRLASASGLCFLFGTVGFAGSLLVVSLTGWKPITNITPFGGVLLMSGWLLWAVNGALLRPEKALDEH